MSIRTLVYALSTLILSCQLYATPRTQVITADFCKVLVPTHIIESCPAGVLIAPIKQEDFRAASTLTKAQLINALSSPASTTPTLVAIQTEDKNCLMEEQSTLLPFVTTPETYDRNLNVGATAEAVQHLLDIFSDTTPALTNSTARDTNTLQRIAFEKRSVAFPPELLVALAQELGCSSWVCDALQADCLPDIAIPVEPSVARGAGAGSGAGSSDAPTPPTPEHMAPDLPAVTPADIVLHDGVLEIHDRKVSLTDLAGILLSSKQSEALTTLHLINTSLKGSLGHFINEKGEKPTFPNLRTLIISNCQSIHLGPHTLEGMQHLRVLDVSDCTGPILDDNCLVHTPNLEALRLTNLGINKLPNLSHCPHLHVLEVSNNKINDRGQPNLSANHNLAIVDLSYNEIKTPTSALIPGVPGRTPLQYLLLNNNGITTLADDFLTTLPAHGFIDLRDNPAIASSAALEAFFKRNGYVFYEDQAYKGEPRAQEVRRWIVDDMRTTVCGYAGTGVQRLAYPDLVNEQFRHRIALDTLHPDAVRALYCWAYRWRKTLILGAIAGVAVGAACGSVVVAKVVEGVTTKTFVTSAAAKWAAGGITAGGALAGIAGDETRTRIKVDDTYVKPRLGWHPRDNEGVDRNESVLSARTVTKKVGGRSIRRTEYNTTTRFKNEYRALTQLTALLSLFKQYLVAYCAYLHWLENYDTLATDQAKFLEAITQFEHSLSLKTKKSLDKIDVAGFSAILHDLITAQPFYELTGRTNTHVPKGAFTFLEGRTADFGRFPQDELSALTKLLPGTTPGQISSLCEVIKLFGDAGATLRAGLHNKFYGVHTPVEIFKMEAHKEPLLDALMQAQQQVFAPMMANAGYIYDKLNVERERSSTDDVYQTTARERMAAVSQWRWMCQTLIHLCTQVKDKSNHLKTTGWLEVAPHTEA